MRVCTRSSKFICISCSDFFDPKHRQRSGQLKRLEKEKKEEKEARMGEMGAREGCGEFLGLA